VRTAGTSGQSGHAGQSGGNGSAGVNNSAPIALGGAGGAAGAGAPADPAGNSGGSGAGGSGVNGASAPGNGGGGGGTGVPGAHGGNAGNGADGQSAAAYVPTGAAIAVLNGGNGGGGAGAGGSGGGGSGGSSGGGGGGGSGGAGLPPFITGGGGGGGGAGAGGGHGGNGASPLYYGTSGATGAGGLQLIIQGRLQSDGRYFATGGFLVFGNSNFATGPGGSAGGTGGAGGSGFNAVAGDGGNGGRGGDGGAGGGGGNSGSSGTGGGGAGGAIFLTSTVMSGGGPFNTRVYLTGTPSTSAPAGRIFFSEAATGGPLNPTYDVTPALISQRLEYVPTYVSPYFGMTTPNLVPSNSTNPGLIDGPGPFGLLPASPTDVSMLAAIANKPPLAKMAILRYGHGITGLHGDYNIVDPTYTEPQFDTYVLVNLTDASASATMGGIALAEYPALSRPEFGGSGVPTPVQLAPGQAWACLGPRFGPVQTSFGLGDVVRVLNFWGPPSDTNAPTVTYLIDTCGDSDIGSQGGNGPGDGALDNNDFVVFIDYFFNANPIADVGSQGGVAPGDGAFDNNDFVVFIDAFFAGCP
jgi:hypothetical protein